MSVSPRPARPAGDAGRRRRGSRAAGRVSEPGTPGGELGPLARGEPEIRAGLGGGPGRDRVGDQEGASGETVCHRVWLCDSVCDSVNCHCMVEHDCDHLSLA